MSWFPWGYGRSWKDFMGFFVGLKLLVRSCAHLEPSNHFLLPYFNSIYSQCRKPTLFCRQKTDEYEWTDSDDILDSRSDLLKHGHSSHERGFGFDIVYCSIFTFRHSLPCMCFCYHVCAFVYMCWLRMSCMWPKCLRNKMNLTLMWLHTAEKVQPWSEGFNFSLVKCQLK